jgi:hypothetical protein
MCAYHNMPANSVEVVSKPQIRFKGKAQADRESAAYIWVCEHLSEAVLHPSLRNQMRIPLAGQRSHWALDGVLKPLLIKTGSQII